VTFIKNNSGKSTNFALFSEKNVLQSNFLFKNGKRVVNKIPSQSELSPDIPNVYGTLEYLCMKLLPLFSVLKVVCVIVFAFSSN